MPWLNGEIESGRLKVKVRQTQKYMQLASNTHRGAYLEDATSIRTALELLSDKDPVAKGTKIALLAHSVKATRDVVLTACLALFQTAKPAVAGQWLNCVRSAD